MEYTTGYRAAVCFVLGLTVFSFLTLAILIARLLGDAFVPVVVVSVIAGLGLFAVDLGLRWLAE